MIKWVASVIWLGWAVTVWAEVHSEESVVPDQPLQLQQLDAEILLLKAELARQKGDYHLVKALLAQIPIEVLKSEDQQRFEELQQYWQQKFAIRPESQAEFFITLDGYLDSPLAILPLTGPYGDLGLALLEGLESQLGDKLQVVDSALFEEPDQLWSLVSLYQPSMILGPLRPQWSLALSQLNDQIPMLTFNHQIYPRANIRSFAPSKKNRLRFLNAFLQFQEIRRLGVLYPLAQNSFSVKQIEQASQSYLNLWQQLNRQSSLPFKIQQAQPITNSVDQAFAQLVNGDQSLKRARWLQHTLSRQLHYQVRARQDLQAIVMIASLEQALQGRPLMTYYHLDASSFIWLPRPLPAQQELQSSLPIWQQTYALFPAYFPLHHSKSSYFDQEVENKFRNSTVGTFYALGETSIKILIALQSQPLPVLSQVFRSRLGKVWVDNHMHFHWLPKIIWMDEGQMQTFAMDNLWPYLKGSTEVD